MQAKNTFTFKDKPDTSTMLLMKVYGVDVKSWELKNIGFTALNIFHKDGEEGGDTLLINSGAFQLPVYAGKISTTDTLDMDTLKNYSKYANGIAVLY